MRQKVENRVVFVLEKKSIRSISYDIYLHMTLEIMLMTIQMYEALFQQTKIPLFL